MLLLLFCLSTMSSTSATIRNNYILNITENHILKNIIPPEDPSRILDLSNLSLKEISEDAFINISKINSLDLSNNSIRSINKAQFSNLINLENLSLAKNQIKELPENCFENLANLRTLNLSSNPFRGVFDEGIFKALPKSCEIFAKDIIVEGISPYAFLAESRPPKKPLPENSGEARYPFPGSQHLTKEHPLDQSLRFQICIIDGFVMKVEELKGSNIDKDCTELRVDHCWKVIFLDRLSISGFTKNWFRLQEFGIQGISLMINDIEDITEELFNELPESVKFVDLMKNRIRRLRKGVIRNDHIMALAFHRNEISEIEPEAFGNMKNLRILHLGDNRLSRIEFTNYLPREMKSIRLYNNMIKEVPVDSFWNLEQLEILEIWSNRIEELDVGTFRGLFFLERLRLDMNRLRKITTGMFKDLGSLKVLSLAGNKLREVSNEMFLGLTSNLTTLYLDNNEIESLKAGTFVDKPSGNLDLRWNKLSNMEKGTFDVPRIDFLDLSHNEIAEFGKGIVKNRNSVNTFSLGDNPIKRLDNGAFDSVEKLGYLWLSSEDIEVIQAGLFENS